MTHRIIIIFLRQGISSSYGPMGPPLRGKPRMPTPPLSRHWVNHEMPQLGVKPKTSGFIVSLDTLPYR